MDMLLVYDSMDAKSDGGTGILSDHIIHASDNLLSCSVIYLYVASWHLTRWHAVGNYGPSTKGQVGNFIEIMFNIQIIISMSY